MIPQNVIDEILDRVSLVDLIGKYIEVKRAGKNYMAQCPFHNDKSPSMSVSDDKGLYHCFACGASGNAIKFLTEYRKMTFPEALQELASMVGIDLSKYESKGDGALSSEKKRLYDINREAMTYYHKLLLNDPTANNARDYLKQRKLTPQTINDFRIGYGGENWQGLIEHLRKKGFKDQELIKASLASKSQKGNIYDRFRGRVVFPILDKNGNCVGFGGRILVGNENAAKYLNTSETAVFHKGSLLFAFNFARDEMVKKRACMITEGYMDVIACHQHGIRNAVAPLGTAFTESQLLIIKRHCDEVWFLFDGDEAGLKAANRALDTAVRIDIRQKVVILPGKMDPYDFLTQRGVDDFREYLKNKRLAPIDFKLKYLSQQVDIVEDKVGFLRLIFPYIMRVDSAVIRDDHLKQTADFLHEGYEIVLEEYRQFIDKKSDFGKAIRSVPKIDPGFQVEEEFAGALTAYPAIAEELEEIITPEMIKNKEAREIFELIIAHPDKKTQDIITHIKNKDIIKIASEYALRDDTNRTVVKEIAYRLKIIYMKKDRERLIRLIERSEAENDTSERNRLLKEHGRIQDELLRIEKLAGKLAYNNFIQ